MKYSIEDIHRAKKNPWLLVKELLFIKYKSAEKINRYWYYILNNKKGAKFMDEDWDNLIILDAARPELLFKTDTQFNGEYSTKISRASESWSFMQENFQSKKHYDTIYITSNPHAHKLDDSSFYKIINLLETDWDQKTGTVPPDAVIKKTKEMHGKHPDKRIVSHFMQPHYPFLRSNLAELGELDKNRQKEKTKDDPWTQLNIWGKHADISRDEVISSYNRNHEIAVQAANDLVSELDGKSIITADHANLIGERGRPIPIRMYGHPAEFYKEELVRVPWIVCDHTERRSIVSDSPVSDEQVTNEDVVADRLEALGYK